MLDPPSIPGNGAGWTDRSSSGVPPPGVRVVLGQGAFTPRRDVRRSHLGARQPHCAGTGRTGPRHWVSSLPWQRCSGEGVGERLCSKQTRPPRPPPAHSPRVTVEAHQRSSGCSAHRKFSQMRLPFPFFTTQLIASVFPCTSSLALTAMTLDPSTCELTISPGGADGVSR